MYSSTCTSACKHNSFHLSSYSCIYILNILLLHSKYVVLLLGLCQRFYYNRVNFFHLYAPQRVNYQCHQIEVQGRSWSSDREFRQANPVYLRR